MKLLSNALKVASIVCIAFALFIVFETIRCQNIGLMDAQECMRNFSIACGFFLGGVLL